LQLSDLLDLNLGLGHVTYHLQTYIYIPNFVEIGKTCSWWTDGWDGFISSTQRSQPKNWCL